MSVKADAETLRSIPIFAECDPLHLQLLAFSSGRQTFNPGDPLIAQGMKATVCYLVLSGHANILVNGPTGDETIGTAGPGALLGEIAMIGEVPYSVTVRASSAISAAVITRALFMRVAEEYPEFGKSVFKTLGGKLTGSLADLAGAKDSLDRAKSFSRL